MSMTQLPSNSSSLKPSKPTWRHFDEIETNHHFSQLLTQVLNHLLYDDQEATIKDTYLLQPLVEKLKQVPKSRAKHLLAAIDHIRFYSSSDPPRKKLPGFRLKPSAHYIDLAHCTVNKQYTIQIMLHNKSAFTAYWRVLTPYQDRQSVFFCSHPTNGVLGPHRKGLLTMELVLLDARDFHRLLALETIFSDIYRTLGAILITTDVAQYSIGATITNETDVGDLDLDACYWHIPAARLKPIAPAAQDTQLNHHLPDAAPMSNAQKAAAASTAKPTSSSSAPTSTSSSAKHVIIDSTPHFPPGSAKDSGVKASEANVSMSELPHLPGATYTLYGVPVHVNIVPLTTELDESEFWNEVNVMSSMRHPHLVNLLGASRFGEEGHLVTRVFDHGSLRAFFQDKTAFRSQKTFPCKVEMLTATAKAIHFVHANDRLHRAISAENIFLTDDFNVKLSVPQLLLLNSLTSLNRQVRAMMSDFPSIFALSIPSHPHIHSKVLTHTCFVSLFTFG